MFGLSRVFLLRGEARVSTLHSLAESKRSRDFHLFGVNLDQEVVHHACRVLPASVSCYSGTVRHDACGNAGQLHHLIGVDHRHAAGNGIAVQVEVRDKEEIPVGRNVFRGGKQSQTHLFFDAIVRGRVFHRSAVGPAVADGHVEVFPVGRKNNSMRAADVALQDACFGCFFQRGAFRSETYRGDAVGGFTDQFYPVFFRWCFPAPRGQTCRQDSADCDGYPIIPSHSLPASSGKSSQRAFYRNSRAPGFSGHRR